jgi:hypothetical protein
MKGRDHEPYQCSFVPGPVLKNGLIYPLEPLPAEWQEGQELYVQSAGTLIERQPSPEEIDRDFADLAALIG